MFMCITAVEPLGGHRIRLRFEDGTIGDLDLRRTLKFHGVWAPLRDPGYVARVRVEADGMAIGWPNEADCDAVLLYSQVTGRKIPGLLRAWTREANAEYRRQRPRRTSSTTSAIARPRKSASSSVKQKGGRA